MIQDQRQGATPHHTKGQRHRAQAPETSAGHRGACCAVVKRWRCRAGARGAEG